MDAAHISILNCDKMAGDRPRRSAYEIFSFSALNVDFSSLSPDPLGSRRPAQAGVENGYPPKNGYFSAIISRSVNTVANRHRYLLVITSNSDKLFIGVNVNDLE